MNSRLTGGFLFVVTHSKWFAGQGLKSRLFSSQNVAAEAATHKSHL